MELWFEKLYVTVITYIPLRSLGLCAAIAIALSCFFLLLQKLIKKTAEFSLMRLLSFSCLFAWLFFIFDATVLSRLGTAGINHGINLQLFTPNPEGIFSTIITAFYNALMFSPIPLLFTFCTKRKSAAYISIPFCLLLAFCVEHLQYTLKVGMFELDDLMYYTLGAVLSALISPLLYKLVYRKKLNQ